MVPMVQAPSQPFFHFVPNLVNALSNIRGILSSFYIGDDIFIINKALTKFHHHGQVHAFNFLNLDLPLSLGEQASFQERWVFLWSLEWPQIKFLHNFSISSHVLGGIRVVCIAYIEIELRTSWVNVVQLAKDNFFPFQPLILVCIFFHNITINVAVHFTIV